MAGGGGGARSARYLRELTGGFNVQEECRQEGDYYILGEYIEDGQLGGFIVFYYGSFVSAEG